MGYKRCNWPDFFENNQTVFYTAAIFIGIALACFPSISKFSDAALKFVLPILLFVTFLQVHFASVIKSFRNGRFIVGLLIGNFVFIPILVLVLVWLGLSFLNSLLDMPPLSKLTSANDPYLYFTAFGAMLLCAPCVDYVVSFCRSGKGDIAALTAALPLLLIFQFCFLGFLFVSRFRGNKTSRAWSTKFKHFVAFCFRGSDYSYMPCLVSPAFFLSQPNDFRFYLLHEKQCCYRHIAHIGDSCHLCFFRDFFDIRR